MKKELSKNEESKLNPIFTLRRLELSQPLVKAMENNEPQALVQLAALALADETTLKLVSAGNKEALTVYIEKAYDMDSDEIGRLLSFFTIGSKRFTLILSGLSPEEVTQLQKQRMKDIKAGLGLPGESA